MTDRVEVEARKRAERHYATVPHFAERKTIAESARVVGWTYEVRNGWGQVIHVTPEGTMYGTAQEALQAARGVG